MPCHALLAGDDRPPGPPRPAPPPPPRGPRLRAPVRPRLRPRPAGAPRRRPRRPARPARRGAAQRLRADAGDRGAQQRRLAAEPRLGLPGALPARGRGTRPRRRRPAAASCSTSPTRAATYVTEHADELGTPWEEVGGGEAVGELRTLVFSVGAAVMQVVQAGTEEQAAEARQGARGDPPLAVPDPRGRRARADDDTARPRRSRTPHAQERGLTPFLRAPFGRSRGPSGNAGRPMPGGTLRGCPGVECA